MRRYTKHLQTILQTQNLQNTKHSTHTPPKQWSMERRKMLASTIQFSHNTPTPQQPHKPHDHHSAGQQDNHNHTYVQLLCAAPDTQQHANTLKNNVRESIAPRSATQCICHCGRASTRISKYFLVAVTHSATSTTLSHNRGHNKTKAP